MINAGAAKAFIEEVYGSVHERNLERLVGYFAQDCVFVDITQSEPAQGRDALRAYMEETWRGLPDFRPVSWELLVEGNRVAAELELEGTHDGEFLGFPASGRRVRWDAAAFYTLGAGGREITREVYYYDLPTLTKQLGADPEG